MTRRDGKTRGTNQARNRIFGALAIAIGLGSAALGLWKGDGAHAQRSGLDRVPFNIPKPSGQPARANEAGKFDYYALVLSWSPSYCAGLVKNDYDPQCNARSGRKFAFVVHGLWPQLTNGYPESCPPRDRLFVQQSAIDKILDIMPSKRLAIHEYQKHGSCSGLEPDGYFALARKFYDKVKVPPRFQNPQAPFFISPADLKKEFAATTPGLTPDMIGVACGGAGDRLKEIRICMTREGEFKPCGSNEAQRRLCRSERMFVPPVRASGNG
jgi:ribonuclease T2